MSYSRFHLMKHLLIMLPLMFISITANAQTSKEELQQQYLEILENRALTGFVDEDGDIQFEYQEKAYFIGVDENDPEFFRVVMFNIWPIRIYWKGIKSC